MNQKTKIPVPLNLPKDKDVQFDTVSFVKDMSEYRLKVLVKRIWEQLMSLANVLETRRKDLPVVLDKIMSGKRWTAKDVHDRYQFGMYDTFIIKYDTLDRTFTLLNKDNETIHPPIKAVSLSEATVYAKELREQLEN